MPATIRAAMLGDLAAILAIEHGAPCAAHWTKAQYEQRLADGIVLVADHGSISGFICARMLAREWEIENMAVLESARRRGIANQLLGGLLQRARSQDASAVCLEVRESNDPARRLYEKHGFQEVGRRRAYYRNPEEAAVLYQLSIATVAST